MWVPESMTGLLLTTTKDNLTEILEFIGKEGKFHIVDFKDRHLQEPEYSETHKNLKEQKKMIDSIIEYFGIKCKKGEEIYAVDATSVEKEAGDFLQSFQSELGKKQQRLKDLKKKETELNLVSELLALLPESETNIEELRNGKYFKMKGGTIPPSEKEEMSIITTDTSIFVFSRPSYADMIPMTIFYPEEDGEIVEKMLSQIRFSENEFFSKLEGSIIELKETIEMGFWEIKEERARIQASINEMGENIEERILNLKRDVEISLIELGWVNKMARTENVFFIEAYIPSRIMNDFDDKCKNEEIYIIDRKEIRRKDKESVNVPTKLNNPEIFRPFEFLVKTFSIPSYRGIDPTVPTGLTFLLFYGIMFGDLGHGIVLITAGIITYFFKYLRRFSFLPITMGISASIFGTLFGEFFGTHPFKAIWFSPFGTPEKAMLLAVYLGIGIVSIGFILRIIEGSLKTDKDDLFLTGAGIPGFIFYLSIILLTFSIVHNIPKKYIITESIFTASTILVIALGKPLKKSLRGGLNTEHILLSIGELIHLSLAMISNTLSFIRVAAFNIAHVILTISIITIADMFGDMVGASKYSTLILGNLFIIILEGMIVFIQALRLEYYEFYSRFFERGKSIYQPMKI